MTRMVRRLPELFFVGAAKAATTSLATVLGADPLFHVNRGDGTGYEIAFHAGRNRERSIDWYLDHFAGATSTQVIVDYSTAYSRYPAWDAAASIADLVPGARLLYQLREPIDRMRSHWRMRIREGTESRAFADAVRSDPTYVEVSSYGLQLTRYLDLFPPDAVLVTTVDEVLDDVAAIVERVRHHVGRPDGDVAGPSVAALPRSNRDAGLRTPPMLRRVVRSRLGRTVRAAMPTAVRSALGTRLRQDVVYPDAELPAELTAELRSRIAEDLEAVRPFLPPTWDGWGLLAPR